MRKIVSVSLLVMLAGTVSGELAARQCDAYAIKILDRLAKTGSCKKCTFWHVEKTLIAAAINEARKKGLSIDLEEASLSGDFSGLDLREANLAKAHVGHVNFSDTDLSGANLQNAEGEGLEWCRAKLVGANMAYAKIVGDFTDADFRDAKLQRTTVFGRFDGADLSGADLREARLLDNYDGQFRTRFLSARFATKTKEGVKAANFEGADIGGAEFSVKAEGIEHVSFKGAKNKRWARFEAETIEEIALLERIFAEACDD